MCQEATVQSRYLRKGFLLSMLNAENTRMREAYMQQIQLPCEVWSHSAADHGPHAFYFWKVRAARECTFPIHSCAAKEKFLVDHGRYLQPLFTVFSADYLNAREASALKFLPECWSFSLACLGTDVTADLCIWTRIWDGKYIRNPFNHLPFFPAYCSSTNEGYTHLHSPPC